MREDQTSWSRIQTKQSMKKITQNTRPPRSNTFWLNNRENIENVTVTFAVLLILFYRQKTSCPLFASQFRFLISWLNITRLQSPQPGSCAGSGPSPFCAFSCACAPARWAPSWCWGRSSLGTPGCSVELRSCHPSSYRVLNKTGIRDW